MSDKQKFAFDKVNFILLAIGMAIVIIGFLLMTGPTSSETLFEPDIFSVRRIKVAPVVCLFGFISMIYAVNFKKGEVLFFNKPLGWTSFKVVGHVRYHICRRIGVKKLKVGHAGTLDPLATGVMIVCTGKATKRIEEFQYHTKEYVATLRLGATTPSYDLEHEIDATYPTEHITRELVEEVLTHFIGAIDQVPPAFSACMVDGKRAYELARKGEEVELKAKQLVIDEIELLECRLDDPEPMIQIRVVCSKGTYIRALARDIGEALHSGAHLTGLIRTRVGDVRLEDCLNPEHFKEWIDGQEIENEEENN